MDFKEKLNNYAKLIIKRGVNVQKDQPVIIMAGVECFDFVRALTKNSYLAGASKVHVVYTDATLSRIAIDNGSDHSVRFYSKNETAEIEKFGEEKAAFIMVKGDDPDLFAGADSDKMKIYNERTMEYMDSPRKYTRTGKVRWNICVAPQREWAERVFTQLKGEKAILALWDSIFKIVGADKDDICENWDKHTELLGVKSKIMTEKKYSELHYISNGTDLKIGLNQNCRWMGGNGFGNDGISSSANIPTQEVFTSPNKFKVNGKVSNKLPLNYKGQMIDGFSLTFEEGKVVDFSAKVGYDALKTLLEIDQGASYLGEVALVPDDSPISNSGIIFFNTLYDENASCHLALGSSFKAVAENIDEMTEEEISKMALNESKSHVDFMIGDDKLNIKGLNSHGVWENIFVNGNWA